MRPRAAHGSCAPGQHTAPVAAYAATWPAPAAEAATKAVAVTIHLMRDRENSGPLKTATNY
jgi:hypothetical protein